jgi:DNA-binding transcriptional regulator YiaG
MARKSRNEATKSLLESLEELEGYVRRGMTIEGIVQEIRTNHPERVRVAFRVPGPSHYSSQAVRRLRKSLALSQANFAEAVGVSCVLVQSWERGVRKPSPLACRLLDVINEDPAAYLARLQRRAAPERRRRAG